MLGIISDGPKDVHENMFRDREIFRSKSPHPILRLYSFSKLSVTLGLFTPVEGLLNQEACQERGVQIASRPTGGGLLFHERDLSFCLYLPKDERERGPLDICVDIHGAILGALQPFLKTPSRHDKAAMFAARRFCFSTVTPYDLIWENAKIGGGAERRSKYGTLYQGSIFLESPNWDIIRSLLTHPDDVYQMRATITPLCELLTEPLSEAAIRDLIIAGVQKL